MIKKLDPNDYRPKPIIEKINEIIEVLNEHTQNNLPDTVLKHAHARKGPDS